MSLAHQTYRLEGHEVHEYELTVPLDHTGAVPGTITVFAREIVRDGGVGLPRLVWFYGGPGGRADRPAIISGWLGPAVTDYRVVLLDQRGTCATRRSCSAPGNGSARAGC